jgi:Tfp pilus assembly protein PilV
VWLIIIGFVEHAAASMQVRSLLFSKDAHHQNMVQLLSLSPLTEGQVHANAPPPPYLCAQPWTSSGAATFWPGPHEDHSSM